MQAVNHIFCFEFLNVTVQRKSKIKQQMNKLNMLNWYYSMPCAKTSITKASIIVYLMKFTGTEKHCL